MESTGQHKVKELLNRMCYQLLWQMNAIYLLSYSIVKYLLDRPAKLNTGLNGIMSLMGDWLLCQQKPGDFLQTCML